MQQQQQSTAAEQQRQQQKMSINSGKILGNLLNMASSAFVYAGRRNCAKTALSLCLCVCVCVGLRSLLLTFWPKHTHTHTHTLRHAHGMRHERSAESKLPRQDMCASNNGNILATTLGSDALPAVWACRLRQTERKTRLLLLLLRRLGSVTNEP